MIMREKLRPIINRVKTYQKEKNLSTAFMSMEEKETVEIGRELNGPTEKGRKDLKRREVPQDGRDSDKGLRKE